MDFHKLKISCYQVACLGRPVSDQGFRNRVRNLEVWRSQQTIVSKMVRTFQQQAKTIKLFRIVKYDAGKYECVFL